jgi:RNA polymerase sigma-70 factor, ECF subfamily
VRTERDEQRLVDLYRRFGPVIFARCRGILGDSAAAEDATQETFMRVQRHLDSSPPQALTWIYRIATNYCFNELRNRRRRAVPVDELPELADTGVEAALADRDLAARLIRRAHPKIAAAAWLHHVEGMDQEEVADILGISRRTVLNRLAEFNRNAMKFVRRTHG